MKDRFFTKLDWAAFWSATLITFVVYFLTLGPSVGLEDSGELATAAANLGVPHPPGYPFWTFCSWLFCKAFSWVTYMGHPTPAWCVSLCSAVFGAFAAGFTAMLICRSGRDFVSEPAVGNLLGFGGGVAGALTFALSPVEWSQSTIVEIYSLNAFFLMWVFLLSYRWMRQPSDKILWLTAFVFGLGLTNYQVLLFAIVPLALIILMTDIGMFRDVFIYLVPAGLTWQLLQIGQLMRADRSMQSDVINKHLPLVGQAVAAPSTAVIIIALVALVASLVAAAVLRRRGEGQQADDNKNSGEGQPADDNQGKAVKAVMYGGGAAAALMLLSAFVFTSKTTWSDATIAPLMAPTVYCSIAAFVVASVVAAALAALKTGEDEKIWSGAGAKFLGASAAFAVLAVIVAACTASAGDGGYQGEVFPWGKSTLMFWVLIAALFAMTAFTRLGLAFAVPVAGFHLAAFTLLGHGGMNGLTHPASWWFGWTIAWNSILLALVWLTLPNGRSVAGAAFFTQLGVSFYAYMPIVSDLRNPPMNWGYPRTWEGFKHAIMRGQYEAIGFQLPTLAGIKGYFLDVVKQFTDVLAVLAIVPFALGHKVVAKENRATFWKWMGAAFSCFLLMSVLLIGLANVKGDIQDGFIQKVKFISSHAMIALWIGYGIVFVGAILLSITNRKFQIAKGNKIAAVFAAVMILIALAFPIYDNYFNDQLVFELGGSEQNGHTFGWQFGAYQLEGAKAINEQLIADEEPLPDPAWPPPMEPYSIFFGGTDPGRFVPTYMIYSALFRPDVYLITQNALADDTYMSVERDLYGDEIWIPSKEDSAEAFNIYVEEVQSGKRQANGDLRIENGRVQVTGALGVMEINGILTKMQHDHDRYRHAFYVEESYVIPWMYPYLSPHGLIMKINADATPYDAKTAAKDRDFWDWYTRRLLKDPMYRRDFAGQKSFSKLRAAIAGLYNKQGRYREGAQAFREACLLYPASPEATFRYAQECLLPFRRYEPALELMDFTDEIDPNNRRTASLRNYVVRIRELTAGISRLESKRRNPKAGFNDDDAFALARYYFEAGRLGEAAALARSLVDKVNDAAKLQAMAMIFVEARADADAEKCFGKYLKLNPSGDAASWAELAKIQHRLGRRQAAQQSFIQAYTIDKQGIWNRLRGDKELYEIAAPLFQRK